MTGIIVCQNSEVNCAIRCELFTTSVNSLRTYLDDALALQKLGNSSTQLHDYCKSYGFVEFARLRSEQARTEYERHVAEHGCTA